MAEKLVLNGGPKAKSTPNYPMYPGGVEIGEEEKKLVPCDMVAQAIRKVAAALA